MAKKYVPSGYQIISIDVSDKTSGTPFTPETEDEKLLHEILSSGEIKKPILLNVVCDLGTLSGFGTQFNINDISLFTFTSLGQNTRISLSSVEDKLVYSGTQE